MIIKISDGAERILKNGGKFRVHSVYKNTLNLWNYSDFISVTAKDTPITPISVVTDDISFENLNVSKGETAVVENSTISLPHCCFTVSPDAETISTFLPKTRSCKTEDLRHASGIIQDVLSRNPPEGSFYHAVFPSEAEHHPLVTGIDEAKNILTEAAGSIACNMYYQASNKLGELIGLGIGLTPAGDDFLTGVLLALMLSDTSSSARLLDKLTGMILSSLCKTGDISSQYMKCACESRFSETLTELSRAIIKGSDENVVKCTNKEIMIGHSSGCDTLSGFIWIVNQLN